VDYIKEALGKDGDIFVANNTPETPVFQLTDKKVITPLIYDKSYIPFLMDYCKQNSITVIIPLFDIDLPVLSKNKKLFEDIGVRVIVSDSTVTRICNDKWETSLFLCNNGIRVPKTYLSLADAKTAIDKKDISFPLIVKPRWGMGSISVYEANNIQELEVLYNKIEIDISKSYLKYESEEDRDRSAIIQEKMTGQEYGMDVINDLEGNYQNTIVKRKIAMRAGETDIAETVDNPELKNLGRVISEKLHHIANLDVDLFLYKDEPFVLEMNARFGGSYPFSHIAGVNLPKAIIGWIKGEIVDRDELLTEKTGVKGFKGIEIVRAKEQAACMTFVASVS
jgi:carbamoyl-phosphate synthase large subunit